MGVVRQQFIEDNQSLILFGEHLKSASLFQYIVILLPVELGNESSLYS